MGSSILAGTTDTTQGHNLKALGPVTLSESPLPERSTLPPRSATCGHMSGAWGAPFIGTNCPITQSWEDVPNTPQYSLNGRTTAGQAASYTVSEKAGSIISKACTMGQEYTDHMKVRNAYSLPKVAISWTPQIDTVAILRWKCRQGELVQLHVLDALAPLSAILEAKEEDLETVSATTDAIKLLGASVQISCLWSTKVISQITAFRMIQTLEKLHPQCPCLAMGWSLPKVETIGGPSKGYKVHPWQI